MASSSNSVSRQESLSESWIDFTRTQTAAQTEMPIGGMSASVKMTPFNGKALEKLLLEAQRESSYASSRIDSLASSRASPHSQHSPINDQPNNSLQLDDPRPQGDVEEEDEEVAGEWVWDWSSRPEAVPPSYGSLRFQHPVTKRHSLSIRNTRIMRGIMFSLENLPLLIFTHACTFLFGAASCDTLRPTILNRRRQFFCAGDGLRVPLSNFLKGITQMIERIE